MRKSWLCMLFVAALAACRSESSRPGEDPSLLVGRVWVEAKPSHGREFVHAMFVAPRGPIGIFQRASAYQAELELFRYDRKNDQLRLKFPQTDRRADLSYRISACDDLPPFDLCLDVSKNPWNGPKRYHAMRKPPRRGQDVAFDALKDELEQAALAAPAD